MNFVAGRSALGPRKRRKRAFLSRVALKKERERK
jgi:hypothetical protein